MRVHCEHDRMVLPVSVDRPQSYDTVVDIVLFRARVARETCRRAVRGAGDEGDKTPDRPGPVQIDFRVVHGTRHTRFCVVVRLPVRESPGQSLGGKRGAGGPVGRLLVEIARPVRRVGAVNTDIPSQGVQEKMQGFIFARVPEFRVGRPSDSRRGV